MRSVYIYILSIFILSFISCDIFEEPNIGAPHLDGINFLASADFNNWSLGTSNQEVDPNNTGTSPIMYETNYGRLKDEVTLSSTDSPSGKEVYSLEMFNLYSGGTFDTPPTLTDFSSSSGSPSYAATSGREGTGAVSIPIDDNEYVDIDLTTLPSDLLSYQVSLDVKTTGSTTLIQLVEDGNAETRNTFDITSNDWVFLPSGVSPNLLGSSTNAYLYFGEPASITSAELSSQTIIIDNLLIYPLKPCPYLIYPLTKSETGREDIIEGNYTFSFYIKQVTGIDWPSQYTTFGFIYLPDKFPLNKRNSHSRHINATSYSDWKQISVDFSYNEEEGNGNILGYFYIIPSFLSGTVRQKTVGTIYISDPTLIYKD
ncbi:hypothetical protein [Spirochaeta cellobiosiphila]|uniref:hypothetical protein n=1 Tax=Spirochaeta cellobiosiphila TaxID=504483 RepID=UPI0004041942|nr:hypothetical protein [Spirochaeta cellobiosiphila]